MTDSQQPVFAFLAGAGAAEPRRIDTHAATVFLFADRALKIKRAIRFPFLDYSTLAKRKAACEAELAVNRPFAPQIYRRVVAITRAGDGTLAIDGEGAPVEWAVEMARFDENATLDHLADRGEIDAAMADALGRAVATAHARAPTVEASPWIAAIGSYVEEHGETFGGLPDLFPARDVTRLTETGRAMFARIRPLLKARGRRGLIRRCHGDLHLGNIVRIDGKPVLFDAIEFSDLIAAGDVLYDLAFLLMDLHARRLDACGNVAFNRYLGEAHRGADIDGLGALPFFLSMRAAIRAKVSAARLDRASGPERDAAMAEARRYFDLACALIAPARPSLIAVGGFSGTGKSLLARMLAPHVPPVPGAVVLRSDVERKRMFGVGETERLPAEAYTPDVAAKLYGALADRARQVLAAGHSAVVDAVFARPDEREAVAATAAACDAPFAGLFLTADLSTRQRRVGARTGDASDADARVAALQEDYDIGALDWRELDASGRPEDTLRAARAALETAPP